MRFLKNGEFQFEKASRFMIDLTDHYLSKKPELSYSGSDTLVELPTADSDDDQDLSEELDPVDVGSRLLSTFSAMNSILSDYRHKNVVDLEFTVERLQKFADIANQLSEEYTEYDETYARNFHEDVQKMCRNILSL